jgi:hypothetical protein
MFNDSTIDFQTKVLARSGLGDDTYLPPCEPAALGGQSGFQKLRRGARCAQRAPPLGPLQGKMQEGSSALTRRHCPRLPTPPPSPRHGGPQQPGAHHGQRALGV